MDGLDRVKKAAEEVGTERIGGNMTAMEINANLHYLVRYD